MALLFGKRLTVRALIHGGVAFMGTDLDFVQRTVILRFAVMLTRSNGAGNALIGFAIHNESSLYISYSLIMPGPR